MKLPISIFIITQDEEKNIKRVLASVKRFDEIIVVDSGSKDKTIEIANSMGAKVSHQDWLGYAGQKQHAMKLCKNDWVLNLDADEVLPEELVNIIERVITDNNVNGVRFSRNDIFIGRKIPFLCKLPNNIRLYKKSMARFDTKCQVHESALIEGGEKFVNTPFLHYGYDSINALVKKNNLYSTLRAEDKFSKNKKASVIKLLLIFPIEFLRKYFFQRYCFFGVRGVIISMVNANYAFLKEAKLFELHMKKK